jgi:phage baseplate assembly protein W
VPLQRLKCTKLLPWIDKPPAVAIPNFSREIWNALTTWEPRIVVESVRPRDSTVGSSPNWSTDPEESTGQAARHRQHPT